MGAYQEILGDMHNLFADTNAVHVEVAEDGYEIRHVNVIKGDSVEEALGYVECSKAELLEKVRHAAERSLKDGRISIAECRALLSRYESGLAGDTYLEEEELPW